MTGLPKTPMTRLTLNLSEDLAARIRHHETDVPRILELGLREVTAHDKAGFNGLAEVFETLADLPAPEEVLALRPSKAFQDRVSALLAKNRSEGLSSEEEREWEQYQYLEHLVRMAKARAKIKLSAS